MSNTKYYVWSAIGKFGSEILGFVGNVLIARILTPEDYGLVAMVSIVLQFSMRLTDAGLNDALIRKSNSDKFDFGTIATYNVVMAVLLYAIIYLTAPLVAIFFEKPILVKVIRLLALAIIFKSIAISGFVQLAKKLHFKQSSIINILGSFCSICIIYTMALKGCGFWALVAQPIVVSILNIILLFIISKWRPFFCFKWNRFKEMFAFSFNLLLSYIIGVIDTNLYSVIIGKYYSTASLGYYNQAHKAQEVPAQGIVGVVMTTSYPIIAKEENPTKRYDIYVNLLKQYVFIQVVTVFSLISVADFTFLFFWGEKWLPSAHLFQLYLLVTLSYPMRIVNSNIVKIQGKSEIYRNLSFVRFGVRILALSICAPFSLEAIILGQIAASFISVSIDIYYCGRTIGFNFKKQYWIWIRSILISLFAFSIGKLLSLFGDNLVEASIVWLFGYLFTLIILLEILKDEVYDNLKCKVKYVIWRKKKEK